MGKKSLKGAYILGYAQSRGPEEMARLFITHPTGIWIHCEEGHKRRGLPLSRNPARVPLYLHVAAGQGQYWKESHSTWWGSLPPQPVRSTPGWARSGLINSLNLSFQGERKRFQLYAILQKATLWRQ